MYELKAALESLCIGNPEEVSEEIEVLLKVDGTFERIRTLREQGYKVVTGYDKSDYVCVTKSAEEPYVCGVVDKENNLIIPMEYDFIYGGDNLGYFYVEKGWKMWLCKKRRYSDGRTHHLILQIIQRLTGKMKASKCIQVSDFPIGKRMEPTL